MKSLPEGVFHWPQYFDQQGQRDLLEVVREGVRQAPLYTPTMPRTGKPLSVRMTNFGPLGWVTDKEQGYRYQATHPVTGRPWPPIPPVLLHLWRELAKWSAPPEACLVNFYETGARMGLHQDRDEQDLEAPVLSVSLGDEALFRIGGTDRGDKTQSFRLTSGDVMMLSGPARLAFHGIDRIYPDTSTLLNTSGRVNLTLRKVSL